MLAAQPSQYGDHGRISISEAQAELLQYATQPVSIKLPFVTGYYQLAWTRHPPGCNPLEVAQRSLSAPILLPGAVSALVVGQRHVPPPSLLDATHGSGVAGCS